MTLKNPIKWRDIELEYPDDTDTVRFQKVFASIATSDFKKRMVIHLPRGKVFEIEAPLVLPGSETFNKKVLAMSSDPEVEGDKTRFKFLFNSGSSIEGTTAAMVLRSSCRINNIIFEGSNNMNLLYLNPEVTYNGGPVNNDDSDSSFKGCDFLGFTGHSALIQNGRNVLIQGCTFNTEGNDQNTVGFWHYFNDIFEDNEAGNAPDPNQPGECRKNRIFNNVFNIARGTAIRAGYMPKHWETMPDRPAYGDIEQFQISGNNCQDCMFAHFKLESNQEIAGLSFDSNTCDTSVSLNDYVLFENGKIKSLMFVGQAAEYKGKKRVKHCFRIARSIKTQTSRIFIDASLKNFESYAVVVGKDKDGDYTALKILGYIINAKNKFAGSNGVAYYDKNSGDLVVLEDSDANQMRANLL